MALGVDQAIAELIRDGDPARSVDGLATLEGWGLYNDADPAKRRIYIGEEPPEPDEVVTVFIEGGGAPIGGGDPNAVGRQPAFTVRCRSLQYARAQELAHEVYPILDYFQGTKNGVPFFKIFANFEPFPISPRDPDDEGGRFTFTQSYSSVTKRYALS